ncbi:Peptidase S11 [Candidatus Desulfosporosinus infrequens]|uniref:Peptidase S11 n=1 Tax=Candidatus Desulfosporosinus infrequens TaxID=2043169 RepID=A0A2U3LNS1_9FIRM|nr:Peptidase S11 [Candidatus Desulfosporosinus infrequens]
MSGSLNSSKSLHSPNFKGILILALAFLFIIGGIVQFNRPYPLVEAKPTSQSANLPGSFTVTFPEQGESAVGTENLGLVASSAVKTPVPIASVAKIMTAYLVLKAHPLQLGQDGPSLTMDAQDFIEYQQAANNGYSVLKIAQGESLTERQLLEGLLLPSGDNIADKLGRWVSGSNAAFVTKMNDTAKSLGMTVTNYADASGVSQTTVSNAVDQIKIAQEAMKDPVFREIVAMPQATLPVAGTVFNVNGMLGKHGVVGIKTGSTSKAGGNFVSATPVVAGDKKHYIIAVVLGQQSVRSLDSALNENVKILDQVRSEFKLYPITPPSAGFGQISSAWNSNSELKATQPVQIFGYPGMEIAYSIKIDNQQLPISPNKNVATLTIQSGQEIQTTPLQNTQPINSPGFLWRLFRY